MSACLLGIDVGSSFVKAALVRLEDGGVLTTSQSPDREMPVFAARPGWAEQDPEMWWTHVVAAVRDCMARSRTAGGEVKAIGVSYQMHGLVCVDARSNVVRPAIIWCDSRAVSIGSRAFDALGKTYCLEHLLNSPGNFTASKLRWVFENEPDNFRRTAHFLLPGDFIAMKLTGEDTTTAAGLSEAILWDYPGRCVASPLMDYFEFGESLIPPIVPVFTRDLALNRQAAGALGLKEGTPVSYRAGDQPNNAFSLNVMHPGEVAATAGTSGVIFAVTDRHVFDAKSRVNTFLHVSNTPEAGLLRNGILLCINGAGILYNWLRSLLSSSGGLVDYHKLNQMAVQIPAGSDGLAILPFGNGAERMFENLEMDSSLHGLNFNIHTAGHLVRAAQEGVAFAMKYGLEIVRHMGQPADQVRAGNANMFRSPVFREAFVNSTGIRLELYDTEGSVGAALGAGVGAGYFSLGETFKNLHLSEALEPDPRKEEEYMNAYERWLQQLNKKVQG